MPKSEFGKLLRLFRLRANLNSLDDFVSLLSDIGLDLDTSILSRWQNGIRLPKDRRTIVFLIKALVSQGGITSPGEANRLCELADKGYLTVDEMKFLFPNFKQGVYGFNDFNQIKIYFTTSGRTEIINRSNPDRILALLKSYKNTIITSTYKPIGVRDQFYVGTDEDRQEIYDEAIEYLQASDLVVIEITTPSTSMGYLLRLSLDLNKMVIALYTDSVLPYFVSFVRNQNLQVIHYDHHNLSKTLFQALSFSSQRVKL